ncbi:hypothetical protein [Microcoleus sp. FACHB-672]|uniref:hypothetical protein n=1 Tax=Microcoleus sp. FACHB-672 TaxID=2692825 RepID=UPI001689CC44|nr:hypothetical protein [Microcoleus sp. FACHB-672]MBD2042253.1 hypothetical protein [Microcoleus sp. FACHB-672]
MHTPQQTEQELYFKDHSLRLIKTAEGIEWIAEDLLPALNLTETALKKVPENLKSLRKVSQGKNGQLYLWQQLLLTVEQRGIELLLDLANQQTAMQFQKWIYEEALPLLK